MFSHTYKIILLLSFLCIRSFGGVENQKPLVVVVCCYNNIKWVQDNLDSIFNQKYENFRLIFVDDGSIDGTGAFVQKYIEKHSLEDKVTLIINSERRRKLANLYRVFYMCHDEEIVILIDGDDKLINTRVFEYINHIYEDPNIWFTYGQYKNEPASEARKWGRSEKGYAAAVDPLNVARQTYRKNKFVFMHLRTFKGWLFKLIKLEDFIAKTVKGYEGDFYPASNDFAIFFPLAEMVHTHMLFIPTVLYIRNLYSEIVGFKVDSVVQRAAAREIRAKNPYTALQEPVYRSIETYRNAQADLIIVCRKNNLKLYAMLERLQMDVEGIKTIYVLYDNKRITCEHIDEIRARFNNVCCIGYERDTFKEQCMECLRSVTCEHVLLANDNVALTDQLNVGHMIYWLERTWAHAFYTDRDGMKYTKKVNWLVPIDEEVYAWNFYFGKGIWRTINPLHMTLYRKSFIQESLQSLHFNSVKDLEERLLAVPVNSEKIGLFYEHAKVEVKRH